MAQETSAHMLKELASLPRAKFRGEPWYNAAGDCVMWFFGEQESYACRIDDKLTVYRAFGTDDLVGCQVKGVAALLQKLGTFHVKYHEKGVSLALLFYISHYEATERADNPLAQKPVYDRLIERANARGLTVTLPEENDLLCPV